MGRNKALVRIKDREMLAWVVEGLKPLASQIIVVAKDESSKSAYEKLVSGVKVVIDAIGLDGPLVGMYSAFLESASEYAYVHPVDSPVINLNVIEYMLQKADGHDASMVRWNDGSIEPLHAVYRVKTSLGAAISILDNGDSSAKALAGHLQVNYIPIDELRKFDDKLVSLLNVNTPQDLEKIVMFLRSHT